MFLSPVDLLGLASVCFKISPDYCVWLMSDITAFAKEAVKKGANVSILSRSVEKLEKSAEILRSVASPDQKVLMDSNLNLYLYNP